MHSTSRHVVEQRNLLGGMDVVTPTADRRAGRTSRVVHVRHPARSGFAAALALVVAYGKKAEAEAHLPLRTRCPRCGKEGCTQKDFGTRRMGSGEVRVQSWCRDCRAHKASAARAPQTGWLFAL